MAKKVMASVRAGEGKKYIKAIKMEKSKRSGAYIFVEEMVHMDNVKDFFTKQSTPSQSAKSR